MLTTNLPFHRLNFIHPRNHPFPFLLYLEWGMLGLMMLTVLLPSPLTDVSQRFPRLTLAAMLLFGLIGLRLPIGKGKLKWSYWAIAFPLLWLVTFLGMQGRVFPFLHVYPLLYIILVMRAGLMLQRPGRLLIGFAAFLMFTIILLRRAKNLDWIEQLGTRIPFLLQERIQERFIQLNIGIGLTFSLLLGLSIAFVILFVSALIAERQGRDQVAIANHQLRQYALQVEDLAAEQERTRIARDIHDSLGHALTALNLQLEAALKLWATQPQQAYRFLNEAKQMGTEALQSVRQSVVAMRTDPLQGQSLEDAIATLLQNFQNHTGIRLIQHIDLPPDGSGNLNLAIYRILQEALTNIRKHAHATEVRIELGLEETEKVPHLVLKIQDNGQGFLPDQNQTGFGLQGMRERTLALGGRLKIESAPGSGCQIWVNIPVKSSSEKF
ncbi:MAG: sensor histidine kinase [Oculatellaceae cyanobacterium Prado106]|nr:sensor histidine kinase [Oculatellaceae cyanobacterium Prado106]